jgi:hypothetical protein
MTSCTTRRKRWVVLRTEHYGYFVTGSHPWLPFLCCNKEEVLVCFAHHDRLVVIERTVKDSDWTAGNVHIRNIGRGLADYELNARLELGKLQLQSGQAAAGKAQLTSLEKDARARSYFLIARKAGAALKMH